MRSSKRKPVRFSTLRLVRYFKGRLVSPYIRRPDWFSMRRSVRQDKDLKVSYVKSTLGIAVIFSTRRHDKSSEAF